MNSTQHHPRPLDTFETALLTELRQVVSERSQHPTRRHTHRPATAVAAAAVVAAAVGVFTVGGGSPAYAVTTADDGDVVIRIHELSDAAGLERALADRGITADVEYAGGAGGSITVDSDGRVTSGESRPEQPEQVPGTGWTSSTGPGAGTPEADPCGVGEEMPISMENDGGDYVITLSGGTIADGNALRVTTFSGDAAATLVTTYTFGAHTCGASMSI